MNPAEAWLTQDDLVAARETFEAGLKGYERPALFGVGVVTSSPAGGTPSVSFPAIGGADHRLPAAVLATACGYRGGTVTIDLSVDELERAIALLEPAEHCAEVDHTPMTSSQP